MLVFPQFLVVYITDKLIEDNYGFHAYGQSKNQQIEDSEKHDKCINITLLLNKFLTKN